MIDRHSRSPPWLLVVAGAAAAAVYVCLVGLLTNVLRLSVAGLPVGHGLFVIPVWRSVVRGLILAGVGVLMLLMSCAAAYIVATRRWDFQGPDWAHIVVDWGGVRKAWKRLNRDDEEGQRHREHRIARAERSNSRRRARRQEWFAKTARLARLERVAERRESSQRHHERVANARNAYLANEKAGSDLEPLPVPMSPSGERLLRILAGFNLVLLAGVIGVGVGQFVAEFESAWWAVVPASVVVFVLVLWLLTTVGPLNAHPGLHVLGWVVVVLLALLSSPPVGLLVLTGVMISTWGRRVVRAGATEPARWLVRSPLPWLAAALYTAVVISYEAMPPISFPGFVVNGTSAQVIGGKLAQSGRSVHLIVCTPLADATSIQPHLRDVTAPPGHTQATVAAAFDSGARPTLASLALGVFGIDWPQAVIVPSLRARTPTCADAPPPGLTIGREDPELGRGVIVGPAPPDGRALNGEPPIQQTADARIARLARRYQPTVEVTVADRFWPVSAGAALASLGPHGTRTCLFTSQTATQCQTVTSIPASGDSTAYLRFPSTSDFRHRAVTEDPTSQFLAFMHGAHVNPGSTHHWLADPGALDPWRTAQVYFYFAGPVHYAGIAGRLPHWPVVGSVQPTPADAVATSEGLIGLQYWFFYPYNYYPLAVRSQLMSRAPLAGDVQNVDLHQGDWEHVTVLLDERTLQPVALYTGRHDDEGMFIPWNSRFLTFDQGHPVVQAAFGGHPTYPRGCGEQTRSKHGAGLLSDWLACGSGRFGFRAASTPLVDLASRDTSWACWPGHFGEGRYGFEVSTPTADWFTTTVTKYVNVAGPRSPLWQAENGSVNHFGVCDQGAAAAEQAAVHGVLGELLARQPAR